MHAILNISITCSIVINSSKQCITYTIYQLHLVQNRIYRRNVQLYVFRTTKMHHPMVTIVKVERASAAIFSMRFIIESRHFYVTVIFIQSTISFRFCKDIYISVMRFQRLFVTICITYKARGVTLLRVSIFTPSSRPFIVLISVLASTPRHCYEPKGEHWKRVRGPEGPQEE